MTHVHEWTPIEGECGKYACACGATGYRAVNGPERGQIVRYKSVHRIAPRITARPHPGVNGSGHYLTAYGPWRRAA